MNKNNLLSDDLIGGVEEVVPQVDRIFSDEALDNISGLCAVLQKIRTRLIAEGYSIDELRKSLLSGMPLCYNYN